MDKLSNVLDVTQKRTKIRNLLYEMSKKDKTIRNQSNSTANPQWVLSDTKK
jgi:ATP-dependent DNA helicase RecG